MPRTGPSKVWLPFTVIIYLAQALLTSAITSSSSTFYQHCSEITTMMNPINPLKPDMIARLDPEFVAYYTEHLSHVPPLHTLPWNPDVRKKPPVAGASEPLKVGLVKDISLSKCKVRVFWPKDPSEAPEGGWPVLLYFHGGECIPQCQNILSKLSHTYFGNGYKGGWTLGSIDTENHLASRLCLSA